MTSFLEPTIGAAFAAERLQIVVKGASQFAIIRVNIACGAGPIIVVDKSKLLTLKSIQNSVF